MKTEPDKRSPFDSYASDYDALLYDRLRERFTADNRFFAQRKIDVIAAFFKRRGIDTRNLRWLDVGCGQGDLLRLGKSLFKECAGCDPSQKMLEFADGLDVRHQEELTTIPFEDGGFDLVTAVCVYHHVPQHRRPSFTKEAIRKLRPGGVFCIIEHNPWNPVTRIIVSRAPIDADAQLLSSKETIRLLADAESRILDTRYFLVVPARFRFALPVENGLTRLPLGGQYAVFGQRY